MATSTYHQNIVLLITFLPLFLIFIIILIWSRLYARGTRTPIKEKLLRAPGETLRRKVEQFDEQLPNYIFGLVLYSAIWLLIFAGYVTLRAKSAHLLAELAAVAFVELIVTALVAWWLILKIKKQRNCFLGFRGERVVGEELNKLMLDGCLVFHDIPGDGDWNVDHAVVAPTGVFAIETKARRKGKCPKGKRDYEVIFDGKMLEYPHCKDSHGIDQVKANAKWLGRHLSNTLGEQIKAWPILTLPGWLVTNRVKPGDGQLWVLSHKQIRSAILDGRERVLDEKLMNRIAYQLEQRCRDVEF